MKTQIAKLKQDLKGIAKTIRQQKKLRKPSHPYHEKYLGNYRVDQLSIEYRHKHVAYCLARGRTLEQIDSGVGLDMDYISWLREVINPESKEKLYVVVNQKLSAAQQAVQSAHAVAEFMKQNPHTLWTNGYLILLKDTPTSTDNMWCYAIMKDFRHDSASFVEPDVGNKTTAYATFGPSTSQYLKDKSLL